MYKRQVVIVVACGLIFVGWNFISYLCQWGTHLLGSNRVGWVPSHAVAVLQIRNLWLGKVADSGLRIGVGDGGFNAISACVIIDPFFIPNQQTDAAVRSRRAKGVVVVFRYVILVGLGARNGVCLLYTSRCV